MPGPWKTKPAIGVRRALCVRAWAARAQGGTRREEAPGKAEPRTASRGQNTGGRARPAGFAEEKPETPGHPSTSAAL